MGSHVTLRAQPPLLAHFLEKPVASATATVDTAAATATDNTGANNHHTSRPQQTSTPTSPTNQQTESSFFQRLPSEIRRMIYVEVWRTYGSEGYGDECNGESNNGKGNDTSAQLHMAVHGGLSPHITAVMMPSMAWLMSPLPSSRSNSRSNSSRSSSSSRSDSGRAGGDAQTAQPSQPAPAPWTRQIHGYTAAPCFLAVDDGDENDITAYDSNARRNSLRAAARAQRRPPEADDVRPQRLAAAHRADLDAVAATNSIYESSDTGTPSSTWRARWNSPWLGHWVCEEYYSGAGQSSTSAASDSGPGSGATATTINGAAPAYSHSHRRRRPPLRRPYLPVLLSCRRAYIEGIDLLYSALTFQFTEMATAEGFLARWPCVSSVRLVMHMSNSLLEFYQKPDDSDQAIITAGVAAATVEDRGSNGNGGGTVINARNNAWQRLCASLDTESLPNLRKLHVWVEAHDLRGWAKTAAETRLFAQLLAAADTQRRLTPERFVLYLPTLPPIGSKERELAGCYLGEEDEGQEKPKGQKLGTGEERGTEGERGEEGEPSKGKAVEIPAVVDRPPLPCTIVRTERPDYWDVHMHMRPVYVNRRMSVGSRVSAMRRAGFL